FFQAEDGIRDLIVTGVQTCALPIFTGCMFSLAINLFQGVLDAPRRLLLAEVIEHQTTAHQQGRRIGESLAGDVGSGTVNSLEHRSEERRVGKECRTQMTTE